MSDVRLGRPPKYPWDEWFRQLERQGGHVRLQAGLDFGIRYEHMRRNILAEAQKRGVGVKTTVQQGGRFLRVDHASKTRRRYYWDRWLDGSTVELIPGQDFTVDVETMRRMARRQAKQRGLGFRSRHFRGSLWIQALDSNALESDNDAA
jgi:hypothetical protein